MATEPANDPLGPGEPLRQAMSDWVMAELGRQRRELDALSQRLGQPAAAPEPPFSPASAAAAQAALEQRIAEINRRLDVLASELTHRLDDQARRLDGLFGDMQRRMDHLNERIDEAHGRLGRLGDIAVRRDEHVQLLARHDRLERALEALRERLLNTGVTFAR
jgi:chromosome segregation ATPase